MSRVCSTRTPGAVSLAEFEWPGLPERTSLRRALRHWLRLDVPNLRIVAEDFRTEASPVDLLGIGSSGEWVSIRLSEENEDLTLLTQGLADVNWLRRRGADLVKLSPKLGVEVSAEPRAMLFCPDFSAETRSAIETLPTGLVELFRYRCLRQQGQLSLLIEACRPAQLDRALPDAMSSTARSPEFASRLSDSEQRPLHSSPSHSGLTGPPSTSTFRTGLVDADLQIEPDEGPLPN
jgi:hypothetical protein